VLWDMLEGTDRWIDCEYNVMYCVVLDILMVGAVSITCCYIILNVELKTCVRYY